MKANEIFVIQSQNSCGDWEIQGEAFADEQKCRDRIRYLEAKYICDRYTIKEIEGIFGLILKGDRSGAFDAIMALDKDEVTATVWEQIRPYGLFGFEKVELKTEHS